jgi:hypothetical protein
MTILKAFLIFLLQLIQMVLPDLGGGHETRIPAQVYSEKDLQGYWIQSFEDDYANVRVYRLSGYDFPPARGRNKMNLKTGGRLEYTPIAPDDRPVTYKGDWRLDDSLLIIRYYKDRRSKIRSFRILGREGAMLKVKGND